MTPVQATSCPPVPVLHLLAADSRSLAVLRAELRRCLETLGWTDTDEIHDVILAVDEAVTNAIEHAYPPGGAGTVQVVATAHPDHTLTITVTDRGRWRPAPTHSEGRGRGIGMMRTSMHTVTITGTDRGTRVELRSRRPSGM
jgi:anti-sigma regulatory factor (Ser/Thr protein kinase)